MGDIRIRPVTDADAEAFASIFNHFVEHSFAAYPEQKVDSSMMRRMEALAGDWPVVMVEEIEGAAVGIAALRPIHLADTLRGCAEVTIFLLPYVTRLGIGTRVLDYLQSEARRLGIHTLIGGASSLNEPSLAFQRRSGFRECGRFERVGRKFGRDFDIVWMQKFL